MSSLKDYVRLKMILLKANYILVGFTDISKLRVRCSLKQHTERRFDLNIDGVSPVIGSGDRQVYGSVGNADKETKRYKAIIYNIIRGCRMLHHVFVYFCS
ncbi:hypothetical protein IMSAGC014_02311 [Bacteroidaceae bacterium]|nr:hypothetical protein IMSAGC014_02311 [Bacteroidaceae bacterium]